MATVNVTNWADFVAAIAVSGDIVVCPIKAKWDMNEIYPEGLQTNITINCAEIRGNETEIRNLHMFGKFIVPADLEIKSLYMKNIVSESDCFFDNSGNTRTITLNKSIMTGIFGVDTITFCNGKLDMIRSVVNLDMTSALYQVHLSGSVFTAIYSRITLYYPLANANFDLFANPGAIKFCMVTIYNSAMPYFDSSPYSGCVVQGNFGDATDSNSYGDHGAFVSVYDVAAMADDFTTANTYFKGVTQQQLYDAAYLQSIGFPIGA